MVSILFCLPDRILCALSAQASLSEVNWLTPRLESRWSGRWYRARRVHL